MDNKGSSGRNGDSDPADQFDYDIGGTGGNGSEEQSSRQRAAERAYTPKYERPPRRPGGEREAAFNSLAWFLEGATGLMEELRHNDLGLSEEFWMHAYAARREGLLALRAILDDMIERSSTHIKQEKERQKRQERRGDIDVEF